MRSRCQILAGAGALLSHVWVLFGDPYVGPWGMVLGRFVPLDVRICVGTIDTQFYLETITQNYTGNFYDTVL